MKRISLLRLIYPLLFYFFFASCQTNQEGSFNVSATLAFDQEEKQGPNKVLTSSTQSLNRYHSALRGFSEANLAYDASSKTISLQLLKDDHEMTLNKINSKFLLPLLPYKHESTINDFDKANLTLAEFARNGVSLSYQENNTKFGFFNASPNLFNDEAEYLFNGTEMEPNKKVKPKRFSIINNCLNPGLWELSGSDAVGEMFHSWFTLPWDKYFEMVKQENDIENPAEELKRFVESNDVFEKIPAELHKLRSVEKELLQSNARLASNKVIGAYSSQDSRRKVQRGFYRIFRDSQEIQASTFGDLEAGDIFSLHSFENPGVYNSNDRMKIEFSPDWKKTIIRQVNPLTSYGGKHDTYGKYGYLEIELFSKDQTQSFVAGNIPIALLGYGEDYRIPAFGVGVLDASEPIERRFLRIEKGQFPHYAYLIQKNESGDFLINNHLTGYEQIYFRPVLDGDELFLKMTIVSYERIVDLMEFEIPITGSLKEKIQKACSEYKKPIHEVYQDSNIF